MKARQNPLSRFEAFIQRMVEGPFARIFPTRLEPVEIERKLERAMEDNTRLQGEGRRLAPNVYDIYLSIKDHQQIVPSQNMYVRDWQNNLVEFARHRHYTLRTMPILRLHADSALRAGLIRIETELADRQNGSPDGGTQALSAEQLAQIRAQLPQGQQLPGIPSASSPNQSPAYTSGVSNPNMSAMPSAPLVTVPPAQLIIRLPQAGQQTYRIEKPIINIGRQLSNDIIVEDKRVSRYHAQIKYQADGQFAIFDLGSTNGITINGTPGMRQHTLRSGDRFTIGSYDFYFERR
ncbi:MAG: antibiotic biosynthesis regulator FhaA [Ktedonobacteraceae bacterium]